MATLPLPFDDTGYAPTNRIENETHRIVAINGRDYNYFVPDFAPFYAESMVVVQKSSGRILKVGVDYLLTHEFPEAREALGRYVYGSITLMDQSVTDDFVLVYQSIGGDNVNNATQAIQDGLIALSAARRDKWDEIAGKPATFPPTKHTHPVTDVDAIVEILNEMSVATELVRDPANRLHLADVQDLDSKFVTPMKQGLAAIADAILAKRSSSNVVVVESLLAGTEVRTGPKLKDVWFDLPYSVTTPIAGTYLVNWSVPFVLEGAPVSTRLQVRFSVSNGVTAEAYCNGARVPLAANRVVKLQARVVGSNVSDVLLSSNIMGGVLSLFRVSN